MRLGVFADSHDHLDNIRHAVRAFNQAGCERVVFAGDFVSTFAIPPLRQLACPLLACFGDNDGNQLGLANGVRLVGEVGTAPFGFRTPDGVKVLVTHMLSQLRGLAQESHVVIYAHTHRARIWRDGKGRLLVNPGETSGWSFRRPTVAIVDTSPLSARLIELPAMPVPTILTSEQGEG